MTKKTLIRFDRREGQRRAAQGSAALSPNEWSGAKLGVLDLSSSGLRARCQVPLSVGKVISVDIPGVGTVPARVMWAAGGEFGAKFLRPVDLRGCAWCVEPGPRAQPERRDGPVRAAATVAVVPRGAQVSFFEL